MKDKPQQPHVVVGPHGVHWLGLAFNEAHAWEIAFGWPSPEEIACYRRRGYYCTTATLSWKMPKEVA
jgi:hypothetical protein